MNKETLLSEILNLKEKLGKNPSQKDILIRLSLSKEELDSFGGIHLSNLFQRVQGKSRELLEHSTKTLEGYNMARNGECDKLENFQEVNNQQPSPCSEKMGKVQRLGLNLRDDKASYGDNSRQRGNGFLIEELQKILPYEKMFDLYSELNISSGILCKWKKRIENHVI